MERLDCSAISAAIACNPCISATERTTEAKLSLLASRYSSPMLFDSSDMNNLCTPKNCSFSQANAPPNITFSKCFEFWETALRDVGELYISPLPRTDRQLLYRGRI